MPVVMSYQLLPPFLETWSLTVVHNDLPVSTPPQGSLTEPGLWFTMIFPSPHPHNAWVPWPAFYLEAGDSNSGPQTFAASPLLPPEPSPPAHVQCFTWKEGC